MGIEKSIEAGRRNFAEANARRAAALAPRRAAEQLAREERQRRILIRRLHRAMKSYAKAVEKETLKNQHGIAIGDYGRCRKANETACEPCKAVAAEYVRVKWANDPKYRAKEKEWYKNNPHKRPISSNKKRVKGGKHRSYTRNQVIERDGFNCYLCNTSVDFTAPHSQGQPGWEAYPHLDHVVPLALGGDDTLENVKLAHAKCNIDKGTRLLPSS
jgi:5-methylcytosine-specific restriction endonuclease McrA